MISTTTIRAFEERIANLEAELASLHDVTGNTYNALWSIFHPDRPDSWAYPGQIVIEARGRVEELSAENERLRAFIRALGEDPDKDAVTALKDLRFRNYLGTKVGFTYFGDPDHGYVIEYDDGTGEYGKGLLTADEVVGLLNRTKEER